MWSLHDKSTPAMVDNVVTGRMLLVKPDSGGAFDPLYRVQQGKMDETRSQNRFDDITSGACRCGVPVLEY